MQGIYNKQYPIPQASKLNDWSKHGRYYLCKTRSDVLIGSTEQLPQATKRANEGRSGDDPAIRKTPLAQFIKRNT